jgi:hypothetical protein
MDNQIAVDDDVKNSLFWPSIAKSASKGGDAVPSMIDAFSIRISYILFSESGNYNWAAGLILLNRTLSRLRRVQIPKCPDLGTFFLKNSLELDSD